MRVLLDDKICEFDAVSVGEAIAAGASVAEEHGRLVVDVIVDGDRWSEEKLGSDDCVAAAAEEVRLVSADPLALVRQTFADAMAALDEANQLQRESAELMQADRHAEALEKLGEAVAIWLSIQKAVVLGSGVLRVDLDELEVNGTPMPEVINRLNEQLRMIRGALEANDPIGLSDTLMYELPDIVSEWRALFMTLRARTEGAD